MAKKKKKLGKPSIRLVIPVGTIGKPTEIREVMLKARRGQAEETYAVRLERGRRDKLQARADKAGVVLPELLRIILEAAINVKLRDLTAFIKLGIAARDDLSKKFEKAKGTGSQKKRRPVLDDKPERDGDEDEDEPHYQDDDEPELDDDEDEDEDDDELETPPTGEPTSTLKRKKTRKRTTGAPGPDEMPKVPRDGRPGTLS